MLKILLPETPNKTASLAPATTLNHSQPLPRTAALRSLQEPLPSSVRAVDQPAQESLNFFKQAVAGNDYLESILKALTRSTARYVIHLSNDKGGQTTFSFLDDSIHIRIKPDDLVTNGILADELRTAYQFEQGQIAYSAIDYKKSATVEGYDFIDELETKVASAVALKATKEYAVRNNLTIAPAAASYDSTPITNAIEAMLAASPAIGEDEIVKKLLTDPANKEIMAKFAKKYKRELNNKGEDKVPGAEKAISLYKEASKDGDMDNIYVAYVKNGQFKRMPEKNVPIKN